MTLLSALKIYAGGRNACTDCGRHASYGQFLPTLRPRRITVTEKQSSDIEAFSAPLDNAMLHRFTASDTSLLYIEHANGRKACSVLLSRKTGKALELERLLGSVKKVRSHLALRFGVRLT